MSDLPVPVYRYRAAIVRVVDGDTFQMNIDLGLRVHAIVAIRLRGIDCPERGTPEGTAATLAATALLIAAKVIVVETYKDTQTFARWVADVYCDGVLLSATLRARGHVKLIEALGKGEDE